MDRSVLANLHTIGGAESTAKVQLYLEDQDVPDPMGKPAADFAACAAIIRGRSRPLPAAARNSSASIAAAADRTTSTSRSAASGRP